jgi:hypothetical protein
MQLKLFVFFGLISISNAVVAETIWCKMFKAGCITEDQKNKQMRYCQQMGNQSYVEGLNEALVDPTIWQFAGENSAQAYARMRRKLMVGVCLRTSTPHDF